MAVSPILGSPKPQFLDDNGDPLSGGMVEFYAAGGSTPLDTYTATVGDVANSNPVILDSRGEPPAQIHGTNDVEYKVVLKNSAGAVQWSEDKIFSSGTVLPLGAVSNHFLHSTIDINATYTVLLTDDGKLINCAANSFTISLPESSTAGEGFTITIKNNGTGIITVNAFSAETINGELTVVLISDESIILTSDAANWNGPHDLISIPRATVIGGTADAMTATVPVGFTSLVDRAVFIMRAVGQITVTNPTIDVNGIGAKSIRKGNDEALILSDIAGSSQPLLLSVRQIGGSNHVYDLLNPRQPILTILTFPTLLEATATEDAWTTVSAQTPAGAVSAIIAVQCDNSDSLGGGFPDANWNGKFYLRPTGSILTNNNFTRKVTADLRLDDIDTGPIELTMCGEGHVSVDSSGDIDYYIESTNFVWDSRELYLIGYYA